MSNKLRQCTSPGVRVIFFREQKKLSQQELADFLGVSRGYIGDIERDRSAPSFNFLTLLASKMDVSIDWILTGEGEMLRGKKPNEDDAPQEINMRAVKMIELLESLSENQQREIFAKILRKRNA